MAIKKNSNLLNTVLWTTQILLSAMLLWAACMKLFQTPEALEAMWPWTGQVPYSLVKWTGVIDLLAGLGLTLPAMLHIRPELTYVAAVSLTLLMVCAMVFHWWRGESPAFNIAVGALAAFVAWGRRGRYKICTT